METIGSTRCQAEPQPARTPAAGGVGPVEGFSHPRQVLLGNAGTVIPNPQNHHARLGHQVDTAKQRLAIGQTYRYIVHIQRIACY